VRFSLQNGVAVITGAASGIGAALARTCAARGCHLALADMQAEALAQVAAAARASGVKVSEHVFDVADNSAITKLPERVLAQHGRVTMLVNNAGVALGGRFEEVSEEEFAWLFDINFWSVPRMMWAFLPVLRREVAAQIVNISSVFGLVGPIGQCAYAASKFAVRGLSEVVRHELEEDNSPVRISVVHPGGVRTNIARNARIAAAASPKTEAEKAELKERTKKLLRLTPEKAAARIVRGVERRQKRILVGIDAKGIDVVQRLWPTNYWFLLRKQAIQASND
jgi:short-subunit dehydrogenase